MSSPDDLIDAWFDRADESALAQLQELLRTVPAARDAYWDHVRVHAGLRAVLQRSAAERSGRRTITTHRRRRQLVRRGHPWAVAAALVMLMIGLVAAMPQVRQTMAASPVISPLAERLAHVDDRTGEAVAAGERLAPHHAPLFLRLIGEQTQMRLEPGSVATLERSNAGVAVHLVQGAIRVDVAKQTQGRTFSVVTPHARSTVLGTTFRVDVDHRTQISVVHGSVAVRAPGGSTVLTAGGYAACEPGAPLVTARRVDHLITDFPSGSARAWNVVSSREVVQRIEAEGFLDQTASAVTFAPSAADPYPWAGIRFQTPQDWRSYTGLSMAFRGTGSGATVLVEFLDNGPAKQSAKGDRAERFAVTFTDNQTGWRELRMPFTSFKRRDFQHPGAPNDALTLSGVSGLSLVAIDGNAQTVVVDRIGLFRE